MTQPQDKMCAKIIEAVRAAWHSVGIQDDGWDWADFALEIQWNIDNPKCEQCDGSGERQYLSDNSPDAYEVTGACGGCNGNGTTEKQTACAQQSAQSQQDALDAARNPLTDEQINHIQETHVGGPTPSYPLDPSDWLNFARAIEYAHGISAIATQGASNV